MGESNYAVVCIGGKQFKAEPGGQLRVPRLPEDAGQEVEFDQVLLVSGAAGLQVGQPLLQGARVKASVLAQGRDRKILVFHKKRRKDHRKKNGHRQPHTVIRVDSIQMP